MGELRRRGVHLLGTLVPAGYLLDDALGVDLVAWHHLQYALVGGTLVAFGLEALRLSGRVEWEIYEHLTREYEQGNLAGYAIYAVGMTAAALAFQPAVALAAMFMLTVGDPISGLLSSGSVGKTPPVLAVMFLVCLGLAWPLVPPGAAVAGAATATLADGVKPVVRGYVIDDNLTIPIGAGAAMALVLAVAA
jgi:dolichol kinase